MRDRLFSCLRRERRKEVGGCGVFPEDAVKVAFLSRVDGLKQFA